jgi:hypothetical protein
MVKPHRGYNQSHECPIGLSSPDFVRVPAVSPDSAPRARWVTDRTQVLQVNHTAEST